MEVKEGILVSVETVCVCVFVCVCRHALIYREGKILCPLNARADRHGETPGSPDDGFDLCLLRQAASRTRP